MKEKYRKLAEEYTACYNYALGYGRMDGILLTYKTTLGMLILIGLIGIFSGEYVRKTDALILCAKYGREKLGAAKIKAGLCFAAAAWLGMTALNLGLTTYFYGWEGWEAFWQDWIYVTAPYQWNQGTAMAFGLGTSLLGALYWAAVVMLLSALVKRAVPAVFCGLAVLLLPSMVMENVAGYLIRRICWLFPSVILGGGQIWCSYDGIYAFGKVLDYQLVVLCLAAAFSVVSGACAVGAFRRHQVRN